ncbi:glycosyltransferase family 2 protein [Frigidibacter oleivorans]|uniref:glycosyltransferase family 2 protein n=1 Tax=Frigidibacter oleivorans TaxID=2487129 RepID=UPI000F8D7A0C|nr:glycosyltransferase [Frigidibacter oleivorans]
MTAAGGAAPPPTSLIVVSRHRPDTLLRCLTAVRQMAHPAMELVVVADPASAARVRALGWPLKLAEFDEPNISAARNAGIALAAGDVLAFTDDDAVPEPTWLARLSAPFADPAVAAAGGWVRGRNGISWQWRSGTVDRLMRTGPLEAAADRTSLHRSAPGRAVEVKGVNCAYRRDLLAGMGGFDPELRYYLDETEVNLRLAGLSALVAVVPGAQVAHYKAGSRQRSPARAPLSLWDVGASSAVFLRRHGADPAEREAALAVLRREERAKALRHMVAGEIEPRDVGRLLQGLDDGIADGLSRRLGPLVPLAEAPPPFMPFPAPDRDGVLIAGRPHQARHLRRTAATQAAEGRIVTLFLFGRGWRRHWQRYDARGYWEQTGGQWGLSDRAAQPKDWSFGNRCKEETVQVQNRRPVHAMIVPMNHGAFGKVSLEPGPPRGD